jgi:hypothetical protein
LFSFGLEAAFHRYIPRTEYTARIMLESQAAGPAILKKGGLNGAPSPGDQIIPNLTVYARKKKMPCSISECASARNRDQQYDSGHTGALRNKILTIWLGAHSCGSNPALLT